MLSRNMTSRLMILARTEQRYREAMLKTSVYNLLCEEGYYDREYEREVLKAWRKADRLSEALNPEK